MATAAGLPMIVEESWVACDSCGKWRRLPPSTNIDPNSSWYCWQHPDPNQKSCDVPEEVVQEGTISISDTSGKKGGGKGKKRKNVAAALAQLAAEAAKPAKLKLDDKGTGNDPAACYNILRPLLEKCCRQGLQSAISEATISPEDYDTILKHCPASGPLLLDALNMASAMAYFAGNPDIQPIMLSAIVACVMEARSS
eukprot:jgi/Ulvmu1/2869/UM146_0011.1